MGWDIVYQIFVQALGIVAMLIIAYSFQKRTQKSVMFIQLFGNLIFIAHFILLKEVAGAIGNALAMLRALVFFLGNKYKWAGHKCWIYIFAFSFLVTYVVPFVLPSSWDFLYKEFNTFNALVGLLPAIGSAIITFGFGVHNAKTVKIIYLIGGPLWLVYCILVSSISGALNEAINIVSIIIALVRFNTHKKAIHHIDSHHDCIIDGLSEQTEKEALIEQNEQG